MSRHHGDQYWTEIQTHAVRDWHGLSDDDIDTLHAVRHEREVRNREQHARARHHRHGEKPELEA